MDKRRTDPREWLAFNGGIFVFTIMWYGMEVMLWGLPIELGMFAIMLFMNFLAGLFGRVGRWMYHRIRDGETTDV